MQPPAPPSPLASSLPCRTAWQPLPPVGLYRLIVCALIAAAHSLPVAAAPASAPAEAAKATAKATETATAQQQVSNTIAPNASGLTLLVVGDSISAEYGLKRGTGWVQLLRRKITTQYPKSTVINASISGDTTAGGRARLPALLKKHRPTHVILELGANDALRGLPLQTTLRNLIAMSRASHQAGAGVVIAGMQMPPNYGRAYQQQFASVFEQAARQTQAALLPFLLTGTADTAAGSSMRFFQQDRIHPNAAAQPYIMRNVWNALHNRQPVAAAVSATPAPATP